MGVGNAGFAFKTLDPLGPCLMLRVVRNFSSAKSALRNLKPTESVPDVNTFLTKIGRNMIQYEGNFESWDQFVASTSKELNEKGIDTRDRRYLLDWFDRFGRGIELQEHKRGTKQWGGERNRNAQRAAFYGRKRAEEREKNA